MGDDSENEILSKEVVGDDNLRAGTFADNIPFIYGSSGTAVNVEFVFHRVTL